MRLILASASALALVACGAPTAPASSAEAAPAVPAAAPEAAPADAAVEVTYGKAATYKLDPTHASLIWRVKHLGLSNYTARFTNFDATLVFNPDDAAATSLTARIDPASVETDYSGDYKAGHADSGFESWNEHLGQSGDYFNASAFPEITFTSTAIIKTGPDTGTVTGDLTFLGVTKPVTLDVKYNGVAQFPWAPEADNIGFSATTTLTRSDFGLTAGTPYVGDEVEVIIEAEFGEVVAPADAPTDAE
ncbi:YceI family protein [Hyphomonas sp.]|uniref:YceI family protein n=1 Tax=Hyphomonas sp. TaxID=87 RepID=UPI003D2A8269